MFVFCPFSKGPRPWPPGTTSAGLFGTALPPAFSSALVAASTSLPGGDASLSQALSSEEIAADGGLLRRLQCFQQVRSAFMRFPGFVASGAFCGRQLHALDPP